MNNSSNQTSKNQVTNPDAGQGLDSGIGPRITIAREAAGLSVAEFAVRLGVTVESVQAWEADERTPRANRLMMMAGVLGTSIAWLLEGREDARMGRGAALGVEDLRGRVELARGLITRGLDMLEGVESALQALAEDENNAADAAETR